MELILSTMSMTGGLGVGADAFAIGFTCKELDLTQPRVISQKIAYFAKSA